MIDRAEYDQRLRAVENAVDAELVITWLVSSQGIDPASARESVAAELLELNGQDPTIVDAIPPR